MKKIILTALIILGVRFFLSAQTNCDNLFLTYGQNHLTSKMFITGNGDYLFAGRLQPNPYAGDSAVYLQKTDSCGNKIWKKFVAVNPGYRYYYAKSFDQSLTGDVFALIDADSVVNINNPHQLRVIKINSNGDQEWISSYSDSILDVVPYGVCATKEGGALVGGWNGFYFTQPPQESILIKFSKIGKTEWVRHYGAGLISSIKQTPDGGYTFIRVKWTKPKTHSYLYKIDSRGNTLWSIETPPFTKNKYNDPYSDGSIYVLPQADGNISVVRTTNPGFYPDTVYLSKYNTAGTELWTKKYSYLHYQLINSIQNTNDKGFLLGGFYSQQTDTSGIYLIRLDENGDTVFTKKVTHSHIDYIDSTPNIYTSGADAYQLTNNKYAVGGLQQVNIERASYTDIQYSSLLIKFVMQQTFVTYSVAKTSERIQALHLFPNPAVALCNIQIPMLKSGQAQLQLVDLYGRILETISLDYQQKIIQLNVTSYSTGMYRVNILNDNKCIATSKLIIAR